MFTRRAQAQGQLCPPSLQFEALIAPPCSSAIFFTIANPRPVPRLLFVTYGSNSDSNRSSAMPGPLSRTSIRLFAGAGV